MESNCFITKNITPAKDEGKSIYNPNTYIGYSIPYYLYGEAENVFAD